METFTALHNVWLSYAMKFVKNTDDANDLVQELYIKLLNQKDLNKLCKNGRVNRSWCYITIRNMYLDGQRNKLQKVDVIDLPEDESNYSFETDEQIDKILEIIKEQGNDPCASYQNKHLMLYVFSGKSLRTIANEMGLTLNIVTNAINNAKRRIKEEYHAPLKHN